MKTKTCLLWKKGNGLFGQPNASTSHFLPLVHFRAPASLAFLFATPGTSHFLRPCRCAWLLLRLLEGSVWSTPPLSPPHHISLFIFLTILCLPEIFISTCLLPISPTSQQCLGACLGLGATLSTLYTSCYVPLSTLQGLTQPRSWPHFSDEEGEAQRWATCPKSGTSEVAKLEFELQQNLGLSILHHAP